jgi:hypothetical protein
MGRKILERIAVTYVQRRTSIDQGETQDRKLIEIESHVRDWRRPLEAHHGTAAKEKLEITAMGWLLIDDELSNPRAGFPAWVAHLSTRATSVPGSPMGAHFCA